MKSKQEMTTGKSYKLKIFPTANALAVAAAELTANLARKSIELQGRFCISLSGGTTPEKLFTILADQPFRDLINWKKTFVFWGDERCVPLEDEKNNAHRAKLLLLDKVKIPSENIYRIPVDLPPAEAAVEYEKQVREFFHPAKPHFDLQFLGLGENGHTASLFPGTPVLANEKDWVKEVFVEEENMFRVTMTATLINCSRNIIFLVSGEKKAEILQTVLTGPYQPEKYPAQLIHPKNGEFYWLTDKAAAGSLIEEQ